MSAVLTVVLILLSLVTTQAWHASHATHAGHAAHARHASQAAQATSTVLQDNNSSTKNDVILRKQCLLKGQITAVSRGQITAQGDPREVCKASVELDGAGLIQQHLAAVVAGILRLCVLNGLAQNRARSSRIHSLGIQGTAAAAAAAAAVPASQAI
jgi:hypothetical protein